MKQGCKVYKRAGVIHVCYKGFHYAPSGSATFVLLTDRVIITPCDSPDAVSVQACNKLGCSMEVWVKTVIGDDNPLGYAQKPGDNSPKKPKEPKKAKDAKKSKDEDGTLRANGTVMSLLTDERRAEMGLWTDAEIDTTFVAIAKNPDALAVMRAIWDGWLRDPSVKSRAFANPFGGLTYDDPDQTIRVRELGSSLGDRFKAVYIR